MSCLCEDCGMNEEDCGDMNYSDTYKCHEPHCCYNCMCFDECMEKQEDECDDELEDSEDEDYCGYFDDE